MKNSFKYWESIEWILHPSKYNITSSDILSFLINEYLFDFKQQVYQAYKNWNLRVRENIRSQTGLSLSSNKDDNSILYSEVPNKKHTVQIKVSISDEVPPDIHMLINKYPEEVWRILIERKTLEFFANKINYIKDLVHYNSIDSIQKNSHPDDFEKIEKDLISFLEFIRKHDIAKELRKCSGDIFGSYNPLAREIKLYWITIALYSLLYEISVEKITLIILSHELAHAYTHAGYDIDDIQWDTEKFMKADLLITEGLAEYYSKRFCQAYDARVPGLNKTYNALLKDAPAVYQQYEEWWKDLDPNEEIGEAVRFAMIIARTKDLTEYSKFQYLIEEGKEKMIYPIEGGCKL